MAKVVASGSNTQANLCSQSNCASLCLCRSPLQEEVDRIMAKAEAGGALGVGTERYATGPPAAALPEGAALRPVLVHYCR